MQTNSLFDAIGSGDVTAIAAQLQDNPTLVNTRDQNGVSAVLSALYQGKREIARLLVAHGATLDVFDAAALGDLDRLTTLIDADPALVDAWSADGFMATHLSAFFAQTEALSLLLERGAPADIMARHSFGVTPLHSAVACGDKAKARTMAEYLVAAGADVNARQGGGETGFTPLMAAAQSDDAVLAKLLLDAGADATIRNSDGKTALDFAKKHDDGEVARLLM